MTLTIIRQRTTADVVRFDMVRAPDLSCCPRSQCCARMSSRIHLVGRPVVRLPGRIATPAIKRVVEQKPGTQLFEIVVVHPRQAERGGEQSRRLRSKVETGR